jgi:hypothetical protein
VLGVDHGLEGFDPPINLEELIEAIREDFGSLALNARGNWCAISKFGDIGAIGSTPTEAVARLWLALYVNAGAAT